MVPSDTLVSRGTCLAQPGTAYVVYLDAGGSADLNLAGQTGTYSVSWYNPRAGGALQPGSVTSVTGGATVGLGTPPSDAGLDWAVIVRRVP
jgi:hypothetical protein